METSIPPAKYFQLGLTFAVAALVSGLCIIYVIKAPGKLPETKPTVLKISPATILTQCRYFMGDPAPYTLVEFMD